MKKAVYLLLLLANMVTASSLQHIVWDSTPINVTLPVGQERLLHFPASLAFGYDASALPAASLRVQNIGGTLYLLAKKSFQPQRVEVKLKASGQIILLNLAANVSGSDTPLSIVLPSQQTEPMPSPPAQIGSVELTRFALHQLYAPKRLLRAVPGIVRVPMHTPKTIPLTLSDSITAMPLASWQGGGLTVTAVLLRNQTRHRVRLAPQQFCGQWQTVSLYPLDILNSVGSMHDTTTAFFVSSMPFATALRNCLAGGVA